MSLDARAATLATGAGGLGDGRRRRAALADDARRGRRNRVRRRRPTLWRRRTRGRSDGVRNSAS
jgi:hypothetical protein